MAGGREERKAPSPNLTSLAPPLSPLQLPDASPTFQHLQGVGGYAYGFKEQDAASPRPGPFVSALSTPKGKGTVSCLALKLRIQGRPQSLGRGGGGGLKMAPTHKTKPQLLSKRNKGTFFPCQLPNQGQLFGKVFIVDRNSTLVQEGRQEEPAGVCLPSSLHPQLLLTAILNRGAIG